MNGDQFATPANNSQIGVFSLRSTAAKRDSLAAELERGKYESLFAFSNDSETISNQLCIHIDPQLSTAKRQQRAQVFTSSIAHANLERQLLTTQTTKLELETKLRERDLQVERLERDRRWFADREKEEREEKERERTDHEEEKVAILTLIKLHNN
jgi:mitotic spindle assembly checkpoint protein MAD1